MWSHPAGRVCRGVELDPLYVDVIVRRFEAATGNQAVLVETGETFEALATQGAGTRPASIQEVRLLAGQLTDDGRHQRFAIGGEARSVLGVADVEQLAGNRCECRPAGFGE